MIAPLKAWSKGISCAAIIGQGPGTGGNYYYVETGNGVACKVHGSVDGSIKGSKPRPDNGPK